MTVPGFATCNSDQRALLLVGHGTRDSRGISEFLEIADRVADRFGEVPVAPCFLEMATPTIDEAVASLVHRGIGHLSVMPMLLAAAGHVKRDIPRAVASSVEPYAGLTFRMARPYGCHEAILNLSELRFDEALAGRLDLPAEQTTLLLVGRGSSDPEARTEMIRICDLRAARTLIGRVEPCFLAMAEPSLDEALYTHATQRGLRVVVQPHLLFHGELVEEVHSKVADVRRRYADKEWLVTRHLGPHRLLVDATISLAAGAGAANPTCRQSVNGQ